MRILQMMFTVLICAAAIFTTSPAAAGCMPVTPGSQEEKIFLAATDLIVRAEVTRVETGLPNRRVAAHFHVLQPYRARGAAPPRSFRTEIPRYLAGSEYTGEPALSKGNFIRTGKTGIFFFSLSGQNWIYQGPGECPSISDETLKTIIPQH
ncbi:MAG: hypothetical protein EA357_10000 [Micavibrio sp.]|nr:MAG: hypothetical protein EA357_10000 [Micavibrio sp.]